MNTVTPPLRLNGRSLGRAWWQLPIIMSVALVILAYLIAVFIAAKLGIRDMSGWTPLLIAGALAGCGLFQGYRFNGRAWAMLGNRAGVQYLPADHAMTRRVRDLAGRVGLPAPKVGIMRGMNAYASGPNAQNAVLVIGVPLTQRLTSDELDAVIGHELGHIATGDVRRMQYGEGFQSMLSGFFGSLGHLVSGAAASVLKDRQNAQMTLMLGRGFSWAGRRCVGFFGEMLLMASSREREFHADAIGAALTSPAAMISALEKVYRADVPATPAEKDFSYMMFRGIGGQLFATHPTLDQRRAALQDGGYIRQLPVLRQAAPVDFAKAA